MFYLWLFAGVLLLLFISRFFTAMIYDTVIVKMTSKWYHAVLSDLGKDKRILDIGIGTATALIQNKDLLVEKNIKVVGVDYDEAYIIKATKVIRNADAQSRVVVICKSIYDDMVPKLVRHKLSQKDEPFDAAYFSGSFTLMPDPVKALQVAAGLIKPGAPIYITQSFQRNEGGTVPGFKFFKPALKYLTTIDFGQVTYEKDLDSIIKKSGMKVLKNEVIEGSINHRWQVARMVVIQA